ncbi:MAG TPA: threonine synthase [Longimicrobiales bacterium]|nr:threonine synthase [Longimicrobiales bacterium]
MVRQLTATLSPTLFVSTRGGGPVSLGEALFAGLAPDGGLYVPTDVGTLGPPPSELRELADAGRWVGPTLLRGTDRTLLERVVHVAFDFPVPLVEVEPGLHVLELYHGPTHAFKDVGARFMARLMAELDPGGGRRTVLVATSGDTGSAVAHAFHGLQGYRVVVLFPKGKVSERQRRQMTTLGGNVIALAVRGAFDDCQRMAKEAFRDRQLCTRHRLTSANSINVGRLIPQSFYYAYAAALLGWADRPVRFVVPSGNVGNLCGGLLAHRAGMPATGFLAATNVNRPILDFLDEGRFEPRPSVPTFSSAMDVGDPSNIERISWLYRDDPHRVAGDVSAASVSDDETRACIADVFRRTGYVLDPHTAVGVRAHDRCPVAAGTPSVVLATAHPAKFPEVVEEATGQEVPLPPGIRSVMNAEEHMDEIGADLAALATALEDR